MFQVPINYYAILACGLSDMLIGMIWYGPLFGKMWATLMGVTEKEVAEARKQGMGRTVFISFSLSLVMAWALAHFIWFTAPGTATLLTGVKTAVWAWIGFIATTDAVKYLYHPKGKPWRLYFLDVGFHLISLLIMGMIIILWG